MPKTAAKKSGDSKKANAKTASKSSTKDASKGASKNKEKKSRGKQNQSVAFLYGGELLKTNRQVLFTTDAIKADEIVQYVRDNYVKYYGADVSGRFVKCEDSDETLKEVLEAAKEKDYLVEPDSNLLKCSVGDATTLLKDAIEGGLAHTFKLGESKKSKGKKGGKKGKDEDSGESGDEESEEDNKKAKSSPKKGGKKTASKKSEESDDSDDDEKVDKASDSEDDDKEDKDNSDEDEDKDSEDEPPKKAKGKAPPKKTSKGK